MQVFLKLEEALELLNSLDSDESDVEIAVLLTYVSELTDEDEGLVWFGALRSVFYNTRAN